jgi:hypothetical protein
MLSPIKNKFPMIRFIFCSVVLFTIFCTSCRKLEHEKIVAEAIPYQPQNLYPVERLPAYFNRVVVLPNFHSDSSSQVLSFSNDIFFKELTKVGIFETISLSESSCLELLGQKSFSSSESLPEDFLNVLIEKYAANGVLFIDLHTYSPYRPLSLGVRAKLVDLKSGEFMWAIDETIDAANASVIATANNYQRVNHVQAISSKTTTSVLQSPRYFCKFVANLMFTTLPRR